MKKKLIQFLMLPIIAVSIGAFVSCKDTNEDLYNELRQEVGLDSPDGSLADRLAALQAELDALKGKCGCPDYSGDITTLKGNVANLLAQLAALQSSLTVNPDGTVDIGGSTVGGGGSSGAGGFTLDDLLGDLTDITGDDGFTTSLMELINNNKTSITDIQTLLTTYGGNITDIQTLLTTYGGNITDIQTLLTTYGGNISNNTNLINKNIQDIADIQTLLTTYGGDISKLFASQETMNNTITGINADLAKLQAALDAIKQCDCEAEFEKVWGAITTLEKGLEEATDKANSAFDLAKQIEQDYKDAVAAVQTIAEKAATAAGEAKQLAQDAQTAADNAQTAADNAQDAADKAQELAKAAQETADEALKYATQITEIAKTVIALESRIAANEADIAALKGQVSQNKTDIETLNGHITRIDGVTDGLKKLIEENTGKINQNTTDIAAIKERLDNIDKDLVEIKKYADAIEQNAKDIAALKETVETLDKTLNDRITGVSDKANEAFQKASEAAAAAAANEEYIKNVETKVLANEAAIKLLQAANAQLEKTVGELDEAVKQNASDIKSLQDNVTTIQGNVTTMGKDIETMKSDIADLKKKVEDIEKDLAHVKEDCAKNLQDAKNYTDTEIATAKVAIMAAVTKELEKYYTKEEIDAMLKDVDDNIQKLKIELMEDYTLKITTLEQTLTVRLDDLETAVGDLKTTLGEHETTLGDHENRITTLEDLVKNLSGGCTCDEEEMKKSIDLLKTMLSNLRDEIEANDELYKKLIQNNADAIDEINKKITDELVKRIEELATKMGGLTTNFDKLKDIVGEIYKNYATKDYVNSITDAIKEDVQNNTNRIEELANQLAEYAGLEARVAALESTTVRIEDYEVDIQNIMDKINANTTEINTLKDAVEGINEDIATLKKEQDNLKGRMDDAEKALKALEDKIDTEINEVKEKIAEIQNNLAKQVTSINLQAATNPWFGMISTPFGTQSNFVIALYGTPMSEVVFPATQYTGGNYVRPSESLTAKDMQMIGNVSETFDAGWPIMFKYDKDEDYAYAGKIYMTINPNTADLNGLRMSIVNSTDEESPITLAPIAKSEEKLQFGWTRADNGFYEADAIVDAMGVEKIKSPKFNTAAIKDAAENVRDMITQIAQTQSIDGNGNRFEKIATDINNIVRDLKFDRSGLKVTYTTENNGKEEEHSVYSEYNLAATAFQPLGLETLKDLNVQTIPGYEKVNSLLDRVAGKVKDKVHVFINDFTHSGLVDAIDALEIKDIEVADLTEDQKALFKVSIDTTLWITGLKYHLDLSQTVNVPVKFTQDVTVPVNIDQNISIDLSNVTVKTPTIVVETDIKNKNGSATLVVPVKDNDGKVIGNAQVDLDQVDVTADASISSGTIELDGTAIAHFTYNEEIGTTIYVDQTVSTTINIDKWIYFGDYELDDDGNIVENGKNPNAKKFHIWVTRDMSDAAESLWGSAQSALGDVNTMLGQLRNIVDEVNKLIEKVNSYDEQFANSVDNIVNKVKGYLQKINGAITSVINSANSRLQPFMVANSRSKGMKRLSGAKNYPTKMSSDMSLYATSQTMELFVPFARKHVAVTNVFSADLSKNVQDGTLDKSILTSVKGDNLNKVLNGTECEIKLNGLKSDYVYEIAYSALDFKGKMATRKYYITLE